MNKLVRKVSFVALFLIILCSFILYNSTAAANEKTNVYDFANLLTEEEIGQLETMSEKLSEERETDFVILTTNDTAGKDVVKYMQDFYDENALGYDKSHGNTAILTIDMQNREVALVGFYKAKKYLDDKRLDLIRNKITPYLSDGDYFEASQLFIGLAYDYMGYRPGVNPENILFKWWFQLVAAVLVAGVVVTLMAYRSGGRVTVNDRTYIDNHTSKIIGRNDTYVRTTVTKVKKPSSNNTRGGGGGITGGGHSHSGSRGGF